MRGRIGSGGGRGGGLRKREKDYEKGGEGYEKGRGGGSKKEYEFMSFMNMVGSRRSRSRRRTTTRRGVWFVVVVLCCVLYVQAVLTILAQGILWVQGHT